MIKKSIKNIIFDWSGTLSDDLTPVYHAAMKIFEKLGKKPISLEEFEREITLPYMNFWNKYFPDLKKEEQDKMFSEAIHQANDPEHYPGVKEILEIVSSKKIKMIVISSVPQSKLIKEVKQYGFSHYFQEINGGIHDKTEVIKEIIRRNDFNPKQTMYVGDMVHDIEAGKKDNVVTVAITWGYQDREKLENSNPDYIISDISELKNII